MTLGGSRKLIVFELNEVVFKIVDDFIRRSSGSHFARLLSTSAQFTARTPDTIYLHPRTSWPTFHRGVPDTLHGILQYNASTAEADAKYPRVWDILRAHGTSVGIGASIGAYPVPEDRTNLAFYLPEPFAPDPQTFPDSLGIFQRFNLGAVGNSGRVVRRGLDTGKALDVLKSSPTLGIGLGTWGKLLSQLALERVNAARVVRRRNCQALLTFDVVFHQLQKKLPGFSTCFTNHVAASMHRYWAAAFPDDYANGSQQVPASTSSSLEHEVTENSMPPEWIETYAGEIVAAMKFADHMLGTLMAFVERNDEYRLLLTTSMGQQAAEARPVENQALLKDFNQFMTGLGFQAHEWRKLPGMEPMNNVELQELSRLEALDARLKQTLIGGDPATPATIDRTGRRLTFSINRQNVDPKAFRVSVEGRDVYPAELGIEIETIQDHAGSTGWHTPKGMAIVFDPRRDLSRYQTRDVVSTTELTSAILASYGVEAPTYMPEPSPAISDALAPA